MIKAQPINFSNKSATNALLQSVELFYILVEIFRGQSKCGTFHSNLEKRKIITEIKNAFVLPESNFVMSVPFNRIYFLLTFRDKMKRNRIVYRVNTLKYYFSFRIFHFLAVKRKLHR